MLHIKLLPLLSLALSLSGAVQAVITGNGIAAFTGDHCNGDMGAIVTCDSSCHSFINRQSHLTGSPGYHCIRYYTADGCKSSEVGATLSGPNECSKVAAGLARSFKCDPTDECLWGN